MYAAYGRNTIANARPKPKPVADPEVRVFDMVEARRQRAIRAAQEEQARRMRSEAFFREQKRIADEAIAKGREAAAAYAQVLRGGEVERERFRHSYRLIEARICRAHRITVHELHSRRRHNQVVMARQAVMYWACRLTLHSLPEIGRMMGGLDHTSVLHGRNVYPQKRAKQGRYLRPVK